jgi:hypothetical protein
MRLKIAIILVIIGAVTTFLSRLAGTLYPRFLQNLPVLKSFGIISLLSFLAIVFFFVIFFIDFAKKEQLLLKIASILMIIGSTAIFVLFVKAVLTLFNVYPSLYFSRPGLLEATVPCINSAFIVFFFIVFYKEMVAKFGFHLKLAVILVIASSFTNFILKSVVLTNYLSSGGFNWFVTLFAKYQVIIIFISAFWFLTNLYFYFTFYRELD